MHRFSRELLLIFCKRFCVVVGSIIAPNMCWILAIFSRSPITFCLAWWPSVCFCVNVAFCSLPFFVLEFLFSYLQDISSHRFACTTNLNNEKRKTVTSFSLPPPIPPIAHPPAHYNIYI